MGCYPSSTPFCPPICYELRPSDVSRLRPLPPPPHDEVKERWADEERIGIAFARNLDFYRAITAFERALILLPYGSPRRPLLEYDVFLCYCLAGRYQEALCYFERSSLAFISADFPAYEDLLITLEECFRVSCEPDRAAAMLQQLKAVNPITGNALELSSALSSADFCHLDQLAHSPDPPPQLDCLLECYCAGKKKEGQAAVLAALLPGAGYLYVGQRQTAVTSFLLNALFIWATYAFFADQKIAAGIVTLSFETGWYFGGIYGSAAAARTYNERLYACEANPYMRHHRLYPLLRITYGF
jgi:tetratricopeptide (TPR) repeat protein